MPHENNNPIRAAEVVLPCDELDETLAFFVDRLGFAVDTIIPADAPRVAVVSGHGLRLRLEVGSDAVAATLRLVCDDPQSLLLGEEVLVAPNGVRVEVTAIEAGLVIPPQNEEVVITPMNEGASWVTGRVGMRYRDLIPNELGGRYGASHIHVLEAGPLNDYVHYHVLRFQLIYCYKGWARLVYEDQGPDFVFAAGDCVLQPPEIRHRVLESSGDLHVIELSCPAGHATHADKTMELPNWELNPNREWAGQAFVHHVARSSEWKDSSFAGFECRDLQIAEGTRGLARAEVLRCTDSAATLSTSHTDDLFFMFVLEGELELAVDGQDSQGMEAGGSFVIPRRRSFTLSGLSCGTELLLVSLPVLED